MAAILVVDDESIVRINLSNIIAGADHHVTLAESTDEALKRIREESFDVVVADYYMPEKTGGDLLKTLRAAGNQLPFVALTSSDEVNTAVELFTNGADDYITKPVHPEELLLRISNVLEIREAKRVARKIEVERELLELEKQQLFSWRQLYAAKEADQAKQMIELLTRAINQGGGFLWLELLADYLKDDSVESYNIPRELAAMIVEAGTNQKQVFDYIGFISNIESIEIKNAEISVSELIIQEAEGARNFLTALTNIHNRQIVIQEPRHICEGTVTIDTAYLEMVIQELLINAVKYSPEDSRISVDFACEQRSKGSYIVVTVENRARASSKKDDTGNSITGIPYEQSELVFDLFYTLDAFPTYIEQERWRDGTGLYICRRLLARFGASISANNGLDYTEYIPKPIVRFTIRLPIDREGGTTHE